MDELLMRDAAPLGADTWKQIDETVEQVARQQLVGRRFVSLAGPVGAGALAAPTVSVQDGEIIRVADRDLLPFTTLSQEFILAYAELTAARQSGLGLDLSPAAIAAVSVCRKEDTLIFDGLRSAKKTQTAPLGEWEKSGLAFAAVAGALEKLIGAGVYSPYALLLSASLYTQAHRVMADTGLLEINQIRELVGNVYFSPLLKAREAFLIGNAPYYLDLVIAQDLAVAYTANVGLDQSFQLIERLALRIKRPAAICALK